MGDLGGFHDTIGSGIFEDSEWIGIFEIENLF